ncbi:hypothetical protein [Asticcacaulis solisilvae]|uniref:hypothetical protein n=1 Tax=Asticcacaulis solisilvae TaxID=1217274 RepID=UPI003FD82739
MADESAARAAQRQTYELADLIAWDCDTLISEPEYQRVFTHPRRHAAMRAISRSTLDAALTDKTLMGIFKDGGRYACAMWAIHLHVLGGLTLQSLKDLCAASGLLSPGRARAVLLFMRYLGYIEPAKTRTGGSQVFVPTQRCYKSWTTHMRMALQAAAEIEPQVRTVIDHIDDPEVFACVVRTQGESLFEGVKAFDLDRPHFRVFINRHAGTLVMADLLTSPGDGDFPPRAVAASSQREFSKRYAVSRVHVSRMLRHGEREGILTMDDGHIHLADAFRAEIELDYGRQVRHLLLSAARAARLLV